MKIVIGIGYPASGKTTYIKEKYLGKELTQDKVDGIRYTVSRKNILIGVYSLVKDSEFQGTDTLPRCILHKLVPFINDLVKDNKYRALIVEGDRVTSRMFFDNMEPYKDIIQVLYFKCPVNSMHIRLEKRGFKLNNRHIKSAVTKVNNLLPYIKQKGFKIKEINTGKNNWW